MIHAFFLLGALFVPNSNLLHRSFRKVKIDEEVCSPQRRSEEVKYSRLMTPRHLRIAQAGVDLFLESEAWFGCVVVDQRPGSGWSLDMFGEASEGNPIRRARSYTYFTELLLRLCIFGWTDGILLVDRMTRTDGDDFLVAIGQAFSAPAPEGGIESALRAVMEVDTALESYQVGQIGDLLTGAVLNDLVEPQGGRAKYKRAFKRYVKDRLGATSFQRDYPHSAEIIGRSDPPKFQVWHWQPKTGERS